MNGNYNNRNDQYGNNYNRNYDNRYNGGGYNGYNDNRNGLGRNYGPENRYQDENDYDE